MIKAPSVTSLRVSLLSANHVKVEWDDVGLNFYYLVQYAISRTEAGPLPPSQLAWVDAGSTRDEYWYYDSIQPNTYYKFRVATTYRGFEQADWVETEEVLSFNENAYYISTMPQFTPSRKFIDEKFIKNNGYIDFNTDNIQASLMNDRFVFDENYSDLSNIQDSIIYDDYNYEIQHHIEPVCVDINRVMLGEMDGVLYAFERFQSHVKASNDKGQTWKYYQAFNDRVGNPVSRTVICQTNTASYVIGYEKLFFGASSTDVRWSDDTHYFNPDERNHIRFIQPDDGHLIGFETERFSEFASLPPIINRRCEAIACSEEFVYVVARDTIRKIKAVNTPIDTTPGSPTEGERIWEEHVYRVTGNSKAVVKKMETLNERLYVYVSGEVEIEGNDPTTSKVIHTDIVGIYQLKDNDEFERVFGNTPYERDMLNHEYSNMSTDGTLLFVNTAEYKFPGTVADDLVWPDVTSSVRNSTPPVYTSSESLHQVSYRTEDGINWEPEPSTYYNDSDYTWLKRGGTRCWITHDNRPLVVYPYKLYTEYTDTLSTIAIDPDRINGEVHNNGVTTIFMNNVNMSGSNKYSNGILFHKDDGSIVGYYQFLYREKDESTVFWKPNNVMLIAELVKQKHDEIFKPDISTGLKDPDLSPLVVKMSPENYLNDNFSAFSKSYLKFISEGTSSSYNRLLNMIRNQFPLEENNFTYLWSEIKKRNIYLDAEKRDSIVRFFEARATDFYSTKGIESSYQFLFKLLYNEDVSIEVESKTGMEYDIIVDSNNITEDIVGTTIYSPTGRCNVTYIDKQHVNGKLQWVVTIHNMIGKFHVGQTIKSERLAFTGMILRGIHGKDIPNIGEYPDRGKTYYVMRIKSQLPLSRYKDDVIRFVHPAGFGFMGITMITVLVNFGISMSHYETIISIMKTYKWDMGLPTFYPDVVARIDPNTDTVMRDQYGDTEYLPGIKAGQAFPVPTDYDTQEKPLHGIVPSERRFKFSPTFDASTPSYCYFRRLDIKKLKDATGNPRDPENPTQMKVGIV